MMFNIELERAIAEIRIRGARKVGLQMPDGLRPRARAFASELEEATGCVVVILGDPCYGACDVHQEPGLDLLVHIGHAPIPDLRPSSPVLFLEVRIDLDVRKGLLESSRRIRDRVGLVATAQHLHLLPEAAEALREMGRIPLIGMGDRRTVAPGQVLGCNITSALAIRSEVEQYLFLGSGYFHPMAVSLGTGLPVLCIDPHRGPVDDVATLTEKVVRQRYAAMAKAKDAKDWLVILCDKPGQRRARTALRCRELLRERGMKADIVQLTEVRAEALLPYRAEAVVSTACPRLAIDDGPHYPIPLLTPSELEMVLGLRGMDDYRLDQINEGDTSG